LQLAGQVQRLLLGLPRRGQQLGQLLLLPRDHIQLGLDGVFFCAHVA